MDVPDDIRETAHSIVYDGSRYDSTGSFFKDDMARDIAKALLDERERAALFIEQHTGSIPDRQEIASAIRRGTA